MLTRVQLDVGDEFRITRDPLLDMTVNKPYTIVDFDSDGDPRFHDDGGDKRFLNDRRWDTMGAEKIDTSDKRTIIDALKARLSDIIENGAEPRLDEEEALESLLDFYGIRATIETRRSVVWA